MLFASFSFLGLCYLNSAVLGFFYVFSFSRFIGACVFLITIIGPVSVAFLLKPVTFWALLFLFCACVAVVFFAVFYPPCLTFLRLGLVLLKGALNCCTIFFISFPMLRHSLASVAMR